MGFVCFIFLEGKKHDAGMLADSGLLNLLQSHAVSPFGQPMCILEIRSLHLTYKPLNASMSAVRVSLEWLFGAIVNYFKFVDFQKKL